MAASLAVSVDEYLHIMYRPDCDYVDGEVIERNVVSFLNEGRQAQEHLSTTNPEITVSLSEIFVELAEALQSDS